jgi:signal peptidase II
MIDPTSASSQRIGRIIAWLIIPVIVAADQATKSWIVEQYYLWESDPWLGELFRITRVHNTGAAFGIAQGYPEIFKVLTMFAIAAIFLHKIATANTSAPYHIALSLVLSGAIGNLIDRFRYNYVVDFLDVGWGDWRWPAFNIADSAITVGVALLLFLSYWETRPVASGSSGAPVCSL